MQGQKLYFLAAAVLLVAARVARGQDEESVNSRIRNRQLYQGDILLTPEQQASLEANSNPNDPFSPQRAVVRSGRSVWLDGRVPYVIEDSLDETAVEVIHEAIAEYNENTCIRFIPRTNQQDYVRFYRGSGCYSYIGRIGGPQVISVGRGCEYTGVVMHEMFHSLGRWHEQSRPDRNIYIQIIEDNIQSGVEGNFEPISVAFVTTQGVPYDLTSIMHYGAYAFSRNGKPTIKPNDHSVPLNLLGQRSGFSEKDLMHLNALYCDDKESSTATWSAWSSWSQCSRTCNGGTRTRLRHCSGGSTCEGSNIDSDDCNTNACPVAPTWSQWTHWSGCSATCGGGRQSRSRRCVNGNTCVGQISQFRSCNGQTCPEPATWSAWESWSSCSSTCEGGTRTKHRTCLHGSDCPGTGVVVQFCNVDVPCQPILKPTPTAVPSHGEWSEWTECTRECGGGTRHRTRMCFLQECEEETENCNTQDCNPEPFLIGLQHIDCYYVPSYSTELGLLEGLTEDLTDDPLTRPDAVQRCAKAATELGYSIFAVSIGYCISGSSNVDDYKYVRSSICNNGIGGYSRGYFGMDVYEIMEAEQVHDFVLDLRHLSPPVVPSPTPTSTPIPHPPLDGAPGTAAPDAESSKITMETVEPSDVDVPPPTVLVEVPSDGDFVSSGMRLTLSCVVVGILVLISFVLY